MSEEKRVWVYGVVAAFVPIVYFAIVLPQTVLIPVREIDYVWPLLAAIAAGIVLNAIAAPQTGKTDERDKQINRLGGHVAFIVMSAFTVVPLALAMARVDQFWIAHALYLAFILSAIVFSAVKIVAYRRGL
ncbi:hypothetical protein ACFFGH_11920 [Lysobacter korlensis]|uniref:Uncharacterized protein n=1 Tax=Lysobacter korlensis TaxID=553636 RepID=A0ABV6RNJ2_9GAMM